MSNRDVFIVGTDIFLYSGPTLQSIHTENKTVHRVKYDSDLYLFIPGIYNKNN
jgi:hypothetical protein